MSGSESLIRAIRLPHSEVYPVGRNDRTVAYRGGQKKLMSAANQQIR